MFKEYYPEILYLLKSRMYPTKKFGNIKTIPAEMHLVKIVNKHDDEDFIKIKALLELRNEFYSQQDGLEVNLNQYILMRHVDKNELDKFLHWHNPPKEGTWFTSLQRDKDYFDHCDHFAIYRCTGKNIHNPNLEKINEKAKNTTIKHKEIIKKSKFLKEINKTHKYVYIDKQAIINLLNSELNDLDINPHLLTFYIN